MVRLRCERTCGVVGQLPIPVVPRKVSSLFGLISTNICSALEEMMVQRTITDRNDRPGGFATRFSYCSWFSPRLRGGGRTAKPLVHDGFEELDGRFAGRSTDVADTVIMIIGEEAADPAVGFDALGPIGVAPVRG